MSFNLDIKSMGRQSNNFDELEMELDILSSTEKAVQSHFQTDEVLLKDNLCDVKALHLKDISKLSPQEIKTKSIGMRLLFWTCEVKAWAAAKAISFGITIGAPSKQIRSQINSSLNELSGSNHLSKVIHALSPGFTNWLQKQLISLELHDVFKIFLKGEYNSLHTFIDVLLPIIYTNIAKNIRDCSINNQAQQQPVMVVDMMSFICEMINRHLPYINPRLESIENAPEGEKRNKIICHVFSHLVDEFLRTALPNGVNELPLIKLPFLSQHYWKIIQKIILPLLFYEAYRQFSAPMRESQKDKLLKKPGGESLVSLAQMAGDKAAELLPEMLADAATEIRQDNLVVTRESPLIASMIAYFRSFLNGSEEFKNWVLNWFTKELIACGKSENHDLKQMWKLLGGYFETIFIHIFISMSQFDIPSEEIKGRLPDAIGIICIRFFGLCSKFFNDNSQKIQERIAQLKKINKNFKEDSELIKIFSPLADDLLSLSGLNKTSNLPLPDFLKEIVVQYLKEIVPEFLMRQYFAISNATIANETVQKKLRSLLFDPKNLKDPSIAINVVSALHNYQKLEINMPNQFYRYLWEESGTEKIAKTLEAMCSFFASAIFSSAMQQLGISSHKFLNDDSNIFIKNFNLGVKSLVETTLLESLVHILNSSENKETNTDNHPKCLVPSNALFQLYSIIDKQLTGMTQALEEIAELYPKGSEAYKLESNKLFTDLSSDLLEFFGINPFTHLPLDEFPNGEALKTILLSSLQKTVLPEMVQKFYMEVMDWQTKLQESFDELKKDYHTSHPKWACKVLAQYATDFIRHYLCHSSDEAAKLLLTNLISYFSESHESSEILILKNLLDLQVDIETLISLNFKKLGENDDSQFIAHPALTYYLESIIAKFFAEFSRTVHDIELNNPDFMVDIAIQILKDTARHFSVVTRAAEKGGVDQAFQVPIVDMLSAFGKDLHDGVPLNPSDSEEAKDLTRLQGCFIPIARKLLKLANLSVKDFPLPSFLQLPLGELMINKILPLVILRFYQKVLEPQVRNTLMLNFVETLYAALNSVEQRKNEGVVEEASILPNSKQKHLYETCGSVVLELVRLIPDTTVQYVFMKEKVKNMSAEAIGNAIMPYLSKWTLLQIIDTVIYSGLPAFHPSKWEGKLGREDLIPRKAFVRPDGKMELKPVKEFKFNFPSTTAELKVQEETNIQEAAKVQRQLRDGFTKTISQQLYAKVWDFVKSLWTSLQDQLNDFIERRFPDKGLKVKAVLDRIFRKIFFDVLGSILLFLTTPVASLVKFIIEKTMIDRRSEDIIENLQSEVLENLIYKSTDTLIDALIKLQKKPQTIITT